MPPGPPPAWQGDWNARILQRIRTHGCERIGEFLRKFPGLPYADLADMLGPDVAPVQIINLQLKEAVYSSTIRPAAMDLMVRRLREHLRSGWIRSTPLPSETRDAYASWSSVIPADEDVLLEVWKSLERLNPPEGWLPKDDSDPLIREAFGSGWKPR